MKNRSNQKQQIKIFSFIKAWEKSGLNKKSFARNTKFQNIFINNVYTF